MLFNSKHYQKGTRDMSDFNEKFNEFNDTEDTTAQFDPNDIQQNKVMAVLAYLSWLVLIPILGAKSSPFARFHANQGLVLAIAEIICGVLLGILVKLPLIGWIFGLVDGVFGLICLIFAIIGIVNAANGRAKELPIVGKFRVLQ